MGISWPLTEARLVQERTSSSAANADTLSLTPACPTNRVQIITACAYIPDVNEAQTISFYKVSSSGAPLTLLNPISMTLNPARATFIEQGMEVFLLPGEYVLVRRGGHTAGSTMSATIQFIEIDLPIYTYDEPQVVNRQQRVLSALRTRLGGGAAGRSGGVEGPRGGGGGGGRTGIPV